MGGCITSAKYSMKALVLPQGTYVPPTPETEETPAVVGYWQITQDPISGDLIRVWVDEVVPDLPETPDVDESLGGARWIKCQANAIITGGLNSQGTTERWTTKGEYENVDFVELRTPANIVLRRRERVTNISGADGQVLWLEEDQPGSDGKLPATVFQVRGVAPSLDIFNRHMENFVLLERAENQELGEPSG